MNILGDRVRIRTGFVEGLNLINHYILQTDHACYASAINVNIGGIYTRKIENNLQGAQSEHKDDS